MKHYRIVADKQETLVMDFEISHTNINTGLCIFLPHWEKKEVTLYHVQRRFLWCWWRTEALYPSTFSDYESAVSYIEKVRGGKLLFTI